MKYYIIHVKKGILRDVGYSVLVSIEKGDEQDPVRVAEKKRLFRDEEDLMEVGYVREIKQEEYEKLLSQTWENCGRLPSKIFAEEDFLTAKELSYKNWEDGETNIGFVFQGQWITNPFVDSSGRFEFGSIEEMYEYYSKDDEGRYQSKLEERVYVFIRKILSLDEFTEKASKKNENIGGRIEDYTMYESHKDNKYVFVLGDKDFCAPIDCEFDFTCDSVVEAWKRFFLYDFGQSKKTESQEDIWTDEPDEKDLPF